MPTTSTKTVKSAGGDYSSLSAWEAGEQANLVAGDVIKQAEVYAFNDTTTFIIDGWTTDATRYIRIYAATGQGHAGYWDATKYYLSGTDTRLIDFRENFIRFEGLQFQLTYTSAGGNHIGALVLGPGVAAASDIRIGYCLFKGVITTTNNIEVHGVLAKEDINGFGTVTVYNSVAFDFYLINNVNFSNVAGPSGFSCHFGDLRCYNCTAYNCPTGFLVVSTFKMTAVNCLSYCDAVNANYFDYSTSANFQNSSNNASTDATAPGTSPLASQTAGNIAFTSTTNTDADFLAIGSGSTLVGAGTNDPLSGIYSDDIRRETRTSTWDIGADEFAAAVAAADTTLIGQILL